MLISQISFIVIYQATSASNFMGYQAGSNASLTQIFCNQVVLTQQTLSIKL
jgi:hypothetical protein